MSNHGPGAFPNVTRHRRLPPRIHMYSVGGLIPVIGWGHARCFRAQLPAAHLCSASYPACFEFPHKLCLLMPRSSVLRVELASLNDELLVKVAGRLTVVSIVSHCSVDPTESNGPCRAHLSRVGTKSIRISRVGVIGVRVRPSADL